MPGEATGVGETAPRQRPDNAPEWWTDDDEAGRWRPDDFVSLYAGPTDLRATFRTSPRHSRTVVAKLARDGDRRLVWAPMRRGPEGKLDADRLAELLSETTVTRDAREVPFGRRATGRPVGSRTRRAGRKVEGLDQ